MSICPTASAARTVVYDNFLYLLAEIEFALVRQVIEWTPEAAQAAQRRLEAHSAEPRDIVARLGIYCASRLRNHNSLRCVTIQ